MTTLIKMWNKKENAVNGPLKKMIFKKKCCWTFVQPGELDRNGLQAWIIMICRGCVWIKLDNFFSKSNLIRRGWETSNQSHVENSTQSNPTQVGLGWVSELCLDVSSFIKIGLSSTIQTFFLSLNFYNSHKCLNYIPKF